MVSKPTFFELGVGDPERGRAFYGALFGWTFAPGPTGGGFAITTDGLPGGMHGGDNGASPYLFFRVDDMDAAVARVTELGGTVEDLGEEERGGRGVARPVRPLQAVSGRPGLRLWAAPAARRPVVLSAR